MKANKKEKNPYKSIDQLGDKWEKYSRNITKILLKNVCKVLKLEKLKKSQADQALIFKGRIQYNPETGKPISVAEWKKLENAIMKYLGVEKQFIEERMTEESYWLGNILSRMDKENREKTELKDIAMGKKDWQDYNYINQDMDMLGMAQTQCGIYIQNISERSRNKIQNILIEGIKNNKTKNEVFQDLWDLENIINVDFDRIVRTETAANSNNGLLLSTLRANPDETVFMKGLSSPGACEHCLRLVNEKIVVLAEGPIERKTSVEIERIEYPLLWPGKSNYGKKPKDYEVASIIHVHCRCTWSPWSLQLEHLLNRQKNENDKRNNF